MQARFFRSGRALALGAAACVLLSPAVAAAAPSPFGVGLPDGGVLPGAHAFPELFLRFIALQRWFSQHLTGAVRDMGNDGAALWVLLGLSFLYGVLHAVGPGHGKAVVSSYVLATRQTVRNGVVLAFVSSLAQALGAIALVMVADLALHLTSIAMTNATVQFEIVSNSLIVLLGLWLVWIKIIRPAMRPLGLTFQPVSVLARPAAAASGVSRFEAIALDAAAAPRMTPPRRAGNAPAAADECDCGALHIPDATAAARLDWARAWTVVASTALRPCTGALILLVFALSHQQILAGVAGTLAMGLGTAITVALLAVLAVSAGNGALALTRADSPWGRRVKRGVESVGALFVLSAGLIMLAGDVLGL